MTVTANDIWQHLNLISWDYEPLLFSPLFPYEKFTTAIPLRLSSAPLQHRELTCGKRRDIQRQARAACLPQGSPFFHPPSPLLRNQNSLDVTQADWSSSPASEQSLARRWQASLELSVRPWRRGSAAGHPQGPINVGVPRKGPSNAPVRRCCNPASRGFMLIPRWSHD